MTVELQRSPAAAPPATPLPPYQGGFAPEQPQAPTVVDLLRVLRRRIWVIALIFAVSLVTALVVTYKMTPVWQAHAQMILAQMTQPIVTSGGGADNSPQMMESVDTQLFMLQDQEMADRAISFLTTDLKSRGASTDAIGVSPEKLVKSITVSNPKDTNLIDLYVNANSPDRATLLANGICQAFMDWKKEIAQHNSDEAMVALEVRANRAQADMQAAEQSEIQYRTSRKLVDVPSQSSAILSRATSNETNIEQLQENLYSQKEKLAALGKSLTNVDQAIKDGTAVRDDSLVLSLQSQLNQLEIDQANAELKYRAKFPGTLHNFAAQIADIQSRLRKAVQGTITNKAPSLEQQGTLSGQYQQAQLDVLFTQAQLSAAQSVQSKLDEQTSQLPVTTLEDERLQQKVELARGLYGSLQNSLNAARLDRDHATGNIQLVQAAIVGDKPVSPNLLLNLLAGILVGALLSVGAVLVLEQADRSVRDMDGLRRLASGPVIGSLPQMNRKEIESLRNGTPPLPLVEAYNMASTNLGFAMRKAGEIQSWDKQIVLVTSAVPGEGKSVTAAALARSLAYGGKCVVLVSADMRRSSLDELFPTDLTIGLAEVLAGTSSLADALADTDLPNLRVLHGGVSPRNPTGLLSGAAIADVLSELRAQADVVLIDSPACSVVADALLITPHCDCVLYVVGAGLVDSDIVRSTVAQLNSAASRSLTYVMNRAPRERQYGYHKYYMEPEHVAPRSNGNGHTNGHSRIIEGVIEPTAVSKGAMPSAEGDEHVMIAAATSEPAPKSTFVFFVPAPPKSEPDNEA